jgi:soluble lytic murein transglycosylase-like protein
MASRKLAVLLGVAVGIGMAALGACGAVSPQAYSVELEPVVVVAARPSLSEILDLVLREPAVSEDQARVAEALLRHSSDTARVNRIASALVREGRRRNIGSSLLVGVLLTENPWLDPEATSFVGARGLMQVMPFHAGKWNCGSRDLFDIESNICHGVAILADNLARSRTLPQALLGYNGCVRGTNTPDCRRYPRKVYVQARKNGDKDSFGG